MDNLDILKYQSVGEFYNNARAKDYKVTTALCHGLSQLIKAKGLTFAEAYNFLLEKNKIILVGKTYIYDLSANELWENTTNANLP